MKHKGILTRRKLTRIYISFLDPKQLLSQVTHFAKRGREAYVLHPRSCNNVNSSFYRTLSKKEGKYQEPIQLSTTPDTGNRMGK